MVNPQKIYRETVQGMSREERLQLAALILNGLAGSAVSSGAASVDAEIGKLYDEIARLSETAASKPAARAQLKVLWRRLRELQSQEALAFRLAFQESRAEPMAAGKEILAEARALRRQLESLASADPAA